MNNDIFKLLASMNGNINVKPSEKKETEQKDNEQKDNLHIKNEQYVYPGYDKSFGENNPKFDEPCFSQQIKPPQTNKSQYAQQAQEENNNSQKSENNSAPQNSSKNNLLSSLLPMLLSGGKPDGNMLASLLSNSSVNSENSQNGILSSLLSNGDLLKSFLGNKKTETPISNKIDVSNLNKLDN